MAYADAADLIARVDTQIVGDLITDDDTDTGIRERPSQATILASDVVTTILGDASGRIDAALQNKGLYTPDQLAALTGNALSHLKRITCIVAVAMLFDRRPTRGTIEIAEHYREQAEKYLLQIQKGENVFGLDDNSDVDAGLMDTAGPTAVELQTRNLLDERMHRFFPDGGSRNPLDRG